jgi:hypothetical protein
MQVDVTSATSDGPPGVNMAKIDAMLQTADRWERAGVIFCYLFWPVLWLFYQLRGKARTFEESLAGFHAGFDQAVEMQFTQLRSDLNVRECAEFLRCWFDDYADDPLPPSGGIFGIGEDGQALQMPGEGPKGIFGENGENVGVAVFADRADVPVWIVPVREQGISQLGPDVKPVLWPVKGCGCVEDGAALGCAACRALPDVRAAVDDLKRRGYLQ